MTTSSIPTVHWNIARHASSGAEPIHQLKCEAVSGSTGANPDNHHGANHQHMVIKIDKVLKFEGGTQNLVGIEVFVAVRFGDNEGLSEEIPGLQAGQPIEVQGEYIPEASAYPTDDNSDPVLPVLHFTHHPVGYVRYAGQYYS
ncbi:MAG: unnamed protein product [uncultured Paraburkholderia sp.]|nr:MAG: unnamed protein product [uncultured Paraburkholderia sp.]